MTRGWKKSERTALLKAVKEGQAKGESLKDIFANFGKVHNRKGDSVRNFYYASISESAFRGEKINGIEKKDIEVFSENQIKKLSIAILSACAKGMSVRGAISQMTKDKSKALRYQNKYRNLLASKNKVFMEVLKEEQNNLSYYDPFTKQVVKIREKPLKTLVVDSSVSLKSKIDIPLSQKLEENSKKKSSGLKSKSKA